jgi:asparagine synthase (glutamine-hydrolysing)
MRGGFVACVGKGSGALDRVAEAMRWHRGKPVRIGRDGLEIAAFSDGVEGPLVETVAGRTILVHGTGPAPLAELQRTGLRFAALEWDGRLLRATRDPLGLAPLFYRVLDEDVWLSTEVHPLMALGTPAPDLEALAARAAFVPYDERTGWHGIARVLPGSTTEIDTGLQIKSAAYWRPEELIGRYRGDRSMALADFTERFHVAVRRCYEPGSGLLLSGGLDSAAVAVAASSAGQRPPHLVHVHFSDIPRTHEQQYAQAVANTVGSALHVVAGDTDAWDLGTELETFGIPYNWLPFGMDRPALTHLAAESITIALDGHDGDGVLGPLGSDWGDLILSGEARRTVELAWQAGMRRAVLGTAVDFIPPYAWLYRLARRLPRTTYMQSVARYFSEPLLSRIFETDINRWRWPSRRWRTRNLNPLLPCATIAFEQKELEAARYGIDMRHPFADRQLVEFLISLPSAVKSDPTRAKSVLLDSLGDRLPGVLRDRPKSDYMAVVRRRVDPAGCVEAIRRSGIRLPFVKYEQIFQEAQSDSERLLFLLVNLTRVHEFARGRWERLAMGREPTTSVT